jgi:ParB family chromosome partitioning protein
VPALVVSADAEDCLIASLVENCARRKHKAIDLLQDIGGMRERGYSISEIAQKTGLSIEYTHGVARLLEKGEQRLLESVEAGVTPLTVAVEIAEADDHQVQRALQLAYERGQLRGKRLLAVKRIVEVRRRRGKGPLTQKGRTAEKMSPSALVRAYQEDVERKREMIRRGNLTRDRLALIVESLRRLARDAQFLGLAHEEGLAAMPEALGIRIRGDGS